MLTLSVFRLLEISAYVDDADQLKSKYEEYTEIKFLSDFSFNPYNLTLIRQLLKAVPIKRFFFDLIEDEKRYTRRDEARFLLPMCSSDPKYAFPTKEFLSVLSPHESHFTIQSESIERLLKFLENFESLRGISVISIVSRNNQTASNCARLGARLNALNVQVLKILQLACYPDHENSFLKALCENNTKLRALHFEDIGFSLSLDFLKSLSLEAFTYRRVPLRGARGSIPSKDFLDSVKHHWPNLKDFGYCHIKVKDLNVDGFKALRTVRFYNQNEEFLTDIHECHIRLKTIYVSNEKVDVSHLLAKLLAYPQYLQKHQTDSLYFPFSCLHLDKCTLRNVPKKAENNFGLIPEYQHYVQLPYLRLTRCHYDSNAQELASFKTAYSAFREAQTPFMWGLYVHRILKDREAFPIGFTDDVLINLFDGFKLGLSWKKKFFKGFCVGYLKHLKENTSGQIPKRLTQLKDVFIPGENNARFFKGCTHFFDQVRQRQVDAEKELSRKMKKMKI